MHYRQTSTSLSAMSCDLQQQLAKSSFYQQTALSRSSILDAACLKQACAAILLSAKQLLEQSQGLVVDSDFGIMGQAVPYWEGLFACDLNGESSAGVHQEDSLTPDGSLTWLGEADTLTIDFDGWLDNDTAWQRGDIEGSLYSSGPSRAFDRCSFNTEVWSALDNDKWPCFPG